jgi:hypothetical protein
MYFHIGTRGQTRSSHGRCIRTCNGTSAHGEKRDFIDCSTGRKGEDLQAVAIVEEALRPPVGENTLTANEHEVGVLGREFGIVLNVQRHPVLQPKKRKIRRRTPGKVNGRVWI